MRIESNWKKVLWMAAALLAAPWNTALADGPHVAPARPARPRATNMPPELAVRFHVNADHMKLLERWRTMTTAERDAVDPRERAAVEEALGRRLTFIFRGRNNETVGNALRDIDADLARLIDEAKDAQGWSEARQSRLLELLTERDRVLGRGTGAEAHFVRDALGNALSEVRFKDTPSEIARLAWIHISEAMRNPTTRGQLIEEMGKNALRDPLLTETIRRPAFRALMEGLIARFGVTYPPALVHLQNYFTRCTQEGGPKPSFRLVENAVEALLPLESKALAMRGMPKNSPARKALDAQVKEMQRHLEESGPQNILEAIAQSRAPLSGQHAEELAEVLNTVAVDKDAGAGLGYIAGAMLRFSRQPGATDAAVEKAMNRFMRLSEREKHALNSEAEQRRFLDNPDSWMAEFLRTHESEAEAIRRERDQYEQVRRIICTRCERLRAVIRGCAA